MIYALITLLGIAAGAVIICCLAWTAGALLFVLALCKSASETRGGKCAAPQLLSMNPDLIRGFKTSLAVLLVACAAGCGDAGQITTQGGKVKVETQDKPAEDSIQAQIHYMNGVVAALKIAKEVQDGLTTTGEAGIKLDEARTNYLRSLSANSRD